MATGHELDSSWLFGGPRLPHFFSDIYTETEWDPPGLAVSMAANVATLTWSASPTAGVTSYDLYRRTPPTGVPFVPGSDTPVATGVTSPYNDSGLSSATYEWQVFGNLTSWTPASITTLVSWHDASDTGSITASGGTASQWNDLSGNGWHVTQGTGANQPATGSRTQNSLNVLDFNGSSSTMSVASYSLSQPFTVVVMMVCDAPANQNTIVAGSGSRSLGVWGGIGGVWSGFGSSSVGGPSVDTSAHVISWVFDGSGAVDQRLDAGTSKTGTPGTNNLDILCFGSEGPGNRFHDGAIGEVIIFTGTSATDRASAESYLRTKWGTP